MSNPVVAEVEARRCVICGRHTAFFGFGPPLVRVAVYTCVQHRKVYDYPPPVPPVRRNVEPDPVAQGDLLSGL